MGIACMHSVIIFCSHSAGLLKTKDRTDDVTFRRRPGFSHEPDPILCSEVGCCRGLNPALHTSLVRYLEQRRKEIHQLMTCAVTTVTLGCMFRSAYVLI